MKAKPNSQKNYLLAMQFYTEFTGMTPEQLLDEAEQKEQNGILMWRLAIKNG